ncbi:FkbM family methyltransferase [Psychrobacillus sp. PGGUH221]|uniref:FkbM family methyltransferase n=1 Tax=Psychrobacillus sp. PGGUH221 TaxID=3020058 RepID=UPI0035C75F16
MTFLEIVNYKPIESLGYLKRFIDDNNEFYLFGADSDGEFCYEWLQKRGKYVKGILDNDKKKKGDFIKGIPILSINEINFIECKIIITSIHSDEIAKQLQKIGLQLFEDFIAYDNLYWIDEIQFSNCVGAPFYESLINNQERFEEVYDMLEDEYSKDIYTRVINYRLTSLNPIKRGKNNLPIPLTIHRVNGIKKIRLKNELTSKFEKNFQKYEQDLLITGLINSTYEYKDIITNANLNVVIDAGGFIGDTAILFAFKNVKGKIYSFEPSKAGFEKILSLQNSFSNIEPVKKGLWNENAVLKFDERDDSLESSRIGEGESDIEVVTLDHFVEGNNISKVNFIKMDIEGAELNALKGARGVIKRDKPDLAICIYHSPTDLWEIPLWIKTNFPEYKVYINHTDGMFVWGTVCFATVRK